MDFKKFAKAVKSNFDKMSEGELFVVNTSKDEVYKTYLSAFPLGTNPIYRERTEHDCQCCRQFISAVGSVVSIVNGELKSVWDVTVGDPTYQIVADELSFLIKGRQIKNVFKHDMRTAGAPTTQQLLESGEVKTWNHFHCEIPSAHFSLNGTAIRGDINNKIGVYQRGLTEITKESIEIVLDLISSNSIYRGEEFKAIVSEFQKTMKEYEKSADKDLFVWSTILSNRSALIKNSVIGTLLMDISEGKDLESAVASYETKVAPENYKRSSSLITKRMIEDAMKTVDELGIRDSLPRQYAKISDVSVNNVLFVDRSVESKMKDSIAEMLQAEVKTPVKKAGKAEAINIEDFIKDVLPKTNSMKLYMENRHKSNLMSLITPQDKEAKSILAWNNNFSWSYNGDVTDSIKERVKKAGGDVSGIIRVSLSWTNTDDLDLHIVEPDFNKISFQNKRSYKSGGQLDVDMNYMRLVRDPVENVTWNDARKILTGMYKIQVNNYTKRENIDVGFTIEVECNGQVFTFNYNKPLKRGGTIDVATFNFDGQNVKIKDVNREMETSGRSDDIWNIKTEDFVEVDTIMLSPNHWDDQAVGNKHYFMMLKDCKNPETSRGLYNEFLRNDLTKHRKVFEILGSKMKCEFQEEQLTGLGFSSTVRNEILCQTQGDINKLYNIKF